MRKTIFLPEGQSFEDFVKNLVEMQAYVKHTTKCSNIFIVYPNKTYVVTKDGLTQKGEKP